MHVRVVVYVCWEGGNWRGCTSETVRMIGLEPSERRLATHSVRQDTPPGAYSCLPHEYLCNAHKCIIILLSYTKHNELYLCTFASTCRRLVDRGGVKTGEQSPVHPMRRKCLNKQTELLFNIGGNV